MNGKINGSSSDSFHLAGGMAGRSVVKGLCLCGLLFGLIGCGASDRVQVHETKGVVLFDGEPMQGGGSISFIPLEGQKGKAPGGTIDKEGKFVMSTYGSKDGAMAGKFRVVIMQSTVSEPEMTGDGDTDNGEVNYESEAVTVPKEKQIPSKYWDTAKSPLEVTVEPGNTNDLTLILEK